MKETSEKTPPSSFLDENNNALQKEKVEIVKIPYKEGTPEQHHRFFFLDAILSQQINPQDAEAYARVMVAHNVTKTPVSPENQEIASRVISLIDNFSRQ